MTIKKAIISILILILIIFLVFLAIFYFKSKPQKDIPIQQEAIIIPPEPDINKEKIEAQKKELDELQKKYNVDNNSEEQINNQHKALQKLKDEK